MSDNEFVECSGGATGVINAVGAGTLRGVDGLIPQQQIVGPTMSMEMGVASSLGQPTYSMAGASGSGMGNKDGSLKLEQDVDEEKDLLNTCQLIVKLVKSCNYRMPTFNGRCKQIVKDMNRHVMEILESHKNRFSSDEDSSDLSDKESRNSKVFQQVKGSRSPRVQQPVSHNGSNNSIVTVDQLTDIFSKFDRRTVPKPEPYNMCEGHDFEDFLALFEEFCTNSYCGSSRLWISELGRLLEGDMSVAFQALRSPSDNYEGIKMKLLQWHLENRDTYNRNRRTKFDEAMRCSGESIRLYAARLEKLFKLAYPRKTVDTSKTLREKFFKTVPSALQQQISTMRNVGISMHRSDITWATILVLATAFDSEHRVAQPSEMTPVFVGAVASCHSVTDAMTQCNVVGEVFESNEQQMRQSRSSVRQSQSQQRNSRSNSSSRNIICFFCKKRGHVKEDCRRLKGLCLACGSPDHKIGQCPVRDALIRSNQNRDSNVNYLGSESRNESGSTKVQGFSDHSSVNSYSRAGPSEQNPLN